MPEDYTQYLVLIFCFASVIFIRIFLFKKAYKNKQKYFYDPMDLAKHVIAEYRKKSTPQ